MTAALLLVACQTADEEPSQPPVDDQQEETGDREESPGGDPLPAGDWTGFPDAPQALSEVAAAGFGGHVWVAGGFRADGNANRSVQIFDPTFETWAGGPELPQAVHHSSLVSTGDALYLVGGYVGSGFDMPTGAVQRLDAASGLWELDTPLPAARAAGAAAWDGQRLVYAGGVGPDGLSGDVFALEDGAWTMMGVLSEPREHLAAASDADGRVWFLAGRTAGLDTNLGTVDLVEGAEITPIGQLTTPRGGVAGFWSATAGACAVGGEDPDRTYDEVECIDGDGQVQVLPSLAAPRHGLGAVVVDGIAFTVLGGPEPGLTTSGTVEGLRLEADAD